jgi:methylthioribose-1-phosphate isomerase
MIDLDLPETLRIREGRLELLDQRRLPGKVEYLRIDTLQQAWQAINTLAVRGAPAIGVAAAYALAQSLQPATTDVFCQRLRDNADYLNSARPTASNLAWATNRLVQRGATDSTPSALFDEALAIHREDLAICQAIGEHGASLISAGSNVLTHCNAGSLAVSRLGTATAPMYVQHARGVSFHVYADETRPLYQGARLTAWELSRAGINVTLACDNMAASLMSQGKVNLILVGTDRVAANGDVVNKIGTLGLAVIARHYGVPFYVACPSSTFDPDTMSGASVPIEQRPPGEVTGDHAAKVPAVNPAFDVTPAALVTGIITEFGITEPTRIGEQISRAVSPAETR